MVIVGGADEAVVGDVHQLPQIQNAPVAQNDVVNELLGSDAGLLGLLLDLLAVLVCSGKELDIVAHQPLVAGHGIGGHGAVSMADVQIGTGIVNGGGNIVITLTVLTHNRILPNHR